MQIRPAHQDDIPQLDALAEERRVLLAQSDPRLHTAPADWAQRLAEGWQVFVGEDGGRLIGFIAGSVIPPSEDAPRIGVIDSLALDAHKYHGGLGRRLVLALRSVFEAADCDEVVVRVPRYHAVEQAFWRALGAQPYSGSRWPSTAAELWMKL